MGVIAVLVAVAVHDAYAHEHKPGETPEQQRVVEWLRIWKRPKGHFSIPDRTYSCCYVTGMQQDCFPVKQVRVSNGVMQVYPDTDGHTGYERWYTIDESISEANQPDPRESPDGRSYFCIAGNEVICYVGGTGL